MDGGAYGGGKAGAPFDPIAFIQRPQVILRAVCLTCDLRLTHFHVKTELDQAKTRFDFV
ncbi:PREDICTED: synaptogyrin-1-like [Eufriesea mexicana]|uniref:synaptogyrin-1-like n=1 Tax=Eufriesea mexicana TaxID=516756 RepID=UPI00083BFB11|nr:PREDICTED: synaptogyrin-1-like [Eufriesea mexicana]